MKRIPIVPTLIVLLAVAYMVHLGLWQLDRLGQKEAMLARYQAAQASAAEVPFLIPPMLAEVNYYHRSRLDCDIVLSMTTLSGRNAKGEAGLAHSAQCQTPEGSTATVVLGWSRDPSTPVWKGGRVTGWIAPGPRLVADPPLSGLQPNAKPDPKDIPNNHLAYAVQWFLFAGVALVIYALALRKRMRAG
ncbi:SURF1 family cytochrome oxidase biogenesis protein [Novosphingobium sp.]|uniref:SURF1 family cytochrome oxidase biogenesis protein n=1 Tax=Novosphingobium sp. TaxID=1874826 RepID=UPI003BAB42D6